MGKDSGIQWTHHTFNCFRGCTRVSEACRFCYAEALAKRNPATLGVWGPQGTRVVASESMWREPSKWNKEAFQAGERRRVFCASLADVFEDWDGPMQNSKGQRLFTWNGSWPWAPGEHDNPTGNGFRPLHMDDVRRRVASLLWETPHLDWLFLTKRIEFAQDAIYRMWFPDAQWPKNYWLGTTVEDRKSGVPRIDILRTIPAPLRFLSVEPMLEDLGRLDLTGIHWVICGGESGSRREFNLRWARSLRDQCKEQDVAFFMKQLGANPRENVAGPDFGLPVGFETDKAQWQMKLRDSHGGNWNEWPVDLRVREFPNTEAATHA